MENLQWFVLKLLNQTYATFQGVSDSCFSRGAIHCGRSRRGEGLVILVEFISFGCCLSSLDPKRGQNGNVRVRKRKRERERERERLHIQQQQR